MEVWLSGDGASLTVEAVGFVGHHRMSWAAVAGGYTKETFSFCLEGFQFAWDFLVAVVLITQKLTEEWPGLHVCVKSPCRTSGCPAEFLWPDMDGTGATYVHTVPSQQGWDPVVTTAMLVSLVSF